MFEHASPRADGPRRRAAPASSVPAHVRKALVQMAADGRPVSAYVYDLDWGSARARELRAALPGWVKVLYAVKANAHPGLLAALAQVVDGFEVSSRSEAERAATAAGAHGRALRLVASGPGKSAPELEALLAHDAVVNVESELELHRVAEIARARGRGARVTLRVNPERTVVSGSLSMGGSPSPFGIAEADVPRLVAAARSLPTLDLLGFHFHSVSNNLDAAAHGSYARWCLRWSLRAARAGGVNLRLVDIGGGLGVAFGDEPGFDLDVFARQLRALRPPHGVRLVVEPGRWLAAGCGWYAAEVTDLKQTHGEWFAVLRGGINHFALPASWDLEHRLAVVPLDAWPHRYPRPEMSRAEVTVVGELCTPEDTLARGVRVERLRAGDLVVFPNAGAYGYEFSLPDFLGYPRPERIALSRARQAAGQTGAHP